MKKGTDIFSPARLFIFVWSLAIGLADLKLSRFQLSWSLFSWIMILIAIAAMLTGMFIVYVINSDKEIPSLAVIRENHVAKELNNKLLFYIIIFLFSSYIISFIVTSIVEGYIPFFTFAPDATRSKWGIFGFGLFIQIVPSILYFMILYFIITQRQKNRKLFIGLLFLLTISTYFLILQRFYIVYCILLTVVFLFYSSNKISTRNIIIIVTIVLLVIYGISAVRTSRYLINIVHYISLMKYSAKYAYFTEPYMYIVMNLENFAHAVDKLNVFDYGYNTFDFILAMTGIKHMIFDYTHIKEFPFIVTVSYNTYTMFFAYYKDFGILGLFFIPFLLGMVISKFYYKMRMNPSLNNISLYGVFAFVIIFSFFIPIISWLHFILNLVVIVIVTKQISLQ
ncbi:MAG: O-antigen polymerase [Bacteroidota bacterium]